MTMPRFQLKFSHNQMGMLIEARVKATDDWEAVELQKYTSFPSHAYGWGTRTAVMSTARQERAYLNHLNGLGIQYEVIQGTDDYR
jgi:hypothetical protein